MTYCKLVTKEHIYEAPIVKGVAKFDFTSQGLVEIVSYTLYDEDGTALSMTQMDHQITDGTFTVDYRANTAPPDGPTRKELEEFEKLRDEILRRGEI